ncbi:MAG: protein kinase [Pirellulales bacterium]|nr:protein kinase [Pirellulales bacterium]
MKSRTKRDDSITVAAPGSASPPAGHGPASDGRLAEPIGSPGKAPHSPIAGQTENFTPRPAPSSRQSRSRSRGLKIRCPHCSNPVELLVDTPFDQMSCGSCGSVFSLVDREQHTRQAAALQRLGRFELVARLGVGGFGSVWKARDTELDRIVAIKIPRKGQLAPAEIEQFFREARAAAQLRHPNIIPVHEVGRHEDAIFIVTELVRGVDLGEWLTARSMSAVEAACLCRTIALALQHAHDHGVIHRDLKPSNIMIDEQGEPNLMDFGLAKREVEEITMTIDGQILGTPAYMSPEQAGGDSHWTDRRTDIYSLGVILFRLLTGELPYRGEAQMQIHQRLTEDAPDPRKLNRHIPKDLATICLKCLERQPSRRYATALALADEFECFLEGRPIQARPISRPARLVRWSRRKPALAALAGLLLILAVCGPLTAAVLYGQQRRLASLLDEKNHLIDRFAADRRAAVATVSRLNDRLAWWEGRAKAEAVWPPQVGQGTRHDVLVGLHRRHYATLARQINDVGDDGTAACGHVALAILADQARRDDEARRQWAAASRRLERLSDQQPRNAAYVMALADCYRQLARLDGDRSGAEEHLQRASTLLDELSADPGNLPAQMAALEVAADRAGLAGYVEGLRDLKRAAELQKHLLAAPASTDFGALYRLTCLLTGRPPALQPMSP